jgi:hypothetical protein
MGTWQDMLMIVPRAKRYERLLKNFQPSGNDAGGNDAPAKGKSGKAAPKRKRDKEEGDDEEDEKKETKSRVKKEAKREEDTKFKKEEANAQVSDNGASNVSRFSVKMPDRNQDIGDDIVVLSSRQKPRRSVVITDEPSQLTTESVGYDHPSEHSADANAMPQMASSNSTLAELSDGQLPSFRKAFTHVRWGDFL